MLKLCLSYEARRSHRVMPSIRNLSLDMLKGVAILSVIFYHFGGNLLPFGYLGVDIFLVVGGYFLFRELDFKFNNNEFRYMNFIFRKLLRLYPLIVLVTLFSMSMGYFLMLPNDYENLAESAVASSLFTNNILQCITTKNYWDVVNFYKPLMHLWYIGILMQSYAIIPILSLAFIKIFKNIRFGLFFTTIFITIISLFLFAIPSFSTAWKFYYLPFRLFEITFGGIMVFLPFKINDKIKTAGFIISLLVLLFLISSRTKLCTPDLMLCLTNFFTAIFITCSNEIRLREKTNIILSVFSSIGKRSYSIYIWHQVLLAFLFYSLFSTRNIINFLIFILFTLIFSILSYQFIEVPLSKATKNFKIAIIIITCTSITAIVVSLFSFNIYLHAGVVRDIPELGISKRNVHKGMHSEYCDRVYSWDRPFNPTNSKKILVIGNSFGRDFGNILYEYDSNLDISFLYYSESALLNNIDRINEADYVFYALGFNYGEVPKPIVDNIDFNKLYVISNKNYGESNGIIYSRRYTKNYYKQTVKYLPELQCDVSRNQAIWGTHFINMMNPVLDENNRIRVFTDDRKFISQDCRHLTQAGAMYYSRSLNLDSILNRY